MRSFLVADLEVDQHWLRPAKASEATDEKFTRRWDMMGLSPLHLAAILTQSALERWVSKSAPTKEAASCKSVLSPA